MASRIIENVLGLIGDTPMVRLNRIGGDGAATILAKLESRNPGGSVKDRIAVAMIDDAEQTGSSSLARPSSSRRAATPVSGWPWSRRFAGIG